MPATLGGNPGTLTANLKVTNARVVGVCSDGARIGESPEESVSYALWSPQPDRGMIRVPQVGRATIIIIQKRLHVIVPRVEMKSYEKV